jgi:hypothetical protein
MSEIPIEIAELRKGADGDTVKELADFLGGKLQGVEVDMSGSEITLSPGEGTTLSRPHLRTLLRKFLHRAELEDFRVIAGKEGAFVIKEKKQISAEEE